MKTLTLIFFLAWVGVISSSAQLVVFSVSFSVTASLQNTEVTSNSTTVTLAAFSKKTITTKTLLELIAEDEFAEGKYGENRFPAGAKLIMILGSNTETEDYSGGFYVTDKNGNELVDVADLIFFQVENDLNIYSYHQTGSKNDFVRAYVGTFLFDDTGAGGTTQFNISQSIEATSAGKSSDNESEFTYTESDNLKLGAGNGTGTFNSVPAVLTSTPRTIVGKGGIILPTMPIR